MSITAVAIIGGIVFIGFGVLCFVAPDLLWSWQKWENSWEGERSERTGMWEAGRVLRGVLLIVGGLVFMLWGLSLD